MKNWPRPLSVRSSARSIETLAASYKLGDSWEALVYKSWNYDRRPSLAENLWKIVVFSRVRESRFEKSDRSRPKEHHDVEYRYSRVADIILQIGWETNTSHAECRQLNLAVNLYCCLLLTRLYGSAVIWSSICVHKENRLVSQFCESTLSWSSHKWRRQLDGLNTASLKPTWTSPSYHESSI